MLETNPTISSPEVDIKNKISFLRQQLREIADQKARCELEYEKSYKRLTEMAEKAQKAHDGWVQIMDRMAQGGF